MNARWIMEQTVQSTRCTLLYVRPSLAKGFQYDHSDSFSLLLGIVLQLSNYMAAHYDVTLLMDGSHNDFMQRASLIHSHYPQAIAQNVTAEKDKNYPNSMLFIHASFGTVAVIVFVIVVVSCNCHLNKMKG